MWKCAQDYSRFFLTAIIGSRRGELLLLRWSHVDFAGQCLNIADAWKGRKEIDTTKSGRSRIVPLSPRMIGKLDNLRVDSLNTQPENFLLCYDDGSRVGEAWWYGRFKKALERVKIVPGDRLLTPLSFCRTINTIGRDAGHDTAKIRAVLGWMEDKCQYRCNFSGFGGADKILDYI